MKKMNGLAALLIMGAFLEARAAQVCRNYNDYVFGKIRAGEPIEWTGEECLFKGADFKTADLLRAYLEEANLKEGDVEEADLLKAYLEEANLEEVDLLRKSLMEDIISNILLRRWDSEMEDILAGGLSKAHRKAKFLRAELRGDRGVDLRKMDLSGANLRGADLRWEYFRWFNLRGTDFREADLSGADLSGADLREADLRGTNLKGVFLGLGGTFFWGAKYDKETKFPDGFDPEALGMVDLTPTPSPFWNRWF